MNVVLSTLSQKCGIYASHSLYTPLRRSVSGEAMLFRYSQTRRCKDVRRWQLGFTRPKPISCFSQYHLKLPSDTVSANRFSGDTVFFTLKVRESVVREWNPPLLVFHLSRVRLLITLRFQDCFIRDISHLLLLWYLEHLLRFKIRQIHASGQRSTCEKTDS